jgi:hypothetical protein
MSYLFENPFASQKLIDVQYNIGGWAEISRLRDIYTGGRNTIPSGDRRDWIHRYLNGELNMAPGQHTHGLDALSGPHNKVKNGEVTISPIDKALVYKIT